jgi:RNA polymerase sigma factor (sigma-70 family)
MNGDLDDWFVSEILPLRPALQRFLRLHWHDEADTSDLLQETLVRVYEAARDNRPRLPKPFVFMVARNLMIDKIRQKQVVSIDRMQDFEWSNIIDEAPSPEQYTAAREELRLLQEALDELPQPCKQVVMLRKIEGISQSDVARRLDITEDAVEHLVAKGIRLLKKSIYGSRRPLIGAARRYLALETFKAK